MGEDVEESLEKNPTNLEEARLPNAPESLEYGNVGFKMLEFMDSVNQELKQGKE